uniref:Uncharacterized protein n=1 Tax=Arundo donax TaxID=35708 RepID=A0A0A9HH59_ARUDO
MMAYLKRCKTSMTVAFTKKSGTRKHI